MTIVLIPARPEVTLDDCLLSMSTFYNGCDFRLRFVGDKVFVGYGCYGIHPNLAGGMKRMLADWIDDGGLLDGEREITDVRPETVMELRRRKPCARCGGFLYKEPPA